MSWRDRWTNRRQPHTERGTPPEREEPYDRAAAHSWVRQNKSRVEQQVQELASYRERFRNGPVGRWRSVHTNADVTTSAVWHFFKDGTGQVAYCSTYAGSDEAPFEWRREGPCCIAVHFPRPGRDAPAPPESGIEFVDVTSEIAWVVIRYDFRVQESDVAGQSDIVLVVTDLSDGGEPLYGLETAPLRFDGPKQLG